MTKQKHNSEPQATFAVSTITYTKAKKLQTTLNKTAKQSSMSEHVTKSPMLGASTARTVTYARISVKAKSNQQQ